MRRAPNFWLLGMLSAACAVKGFTIEDELPGGTGGSSAGSGATAGKTGDAGSPSQGGSGAAAGTAAGGKMSSAGSQSEAGAMTGDAGEPSVGVGGEGAGGAPSSAVAPCALSPNGQPPLLCDDFESGKLSNTLWSPPPGIGVSTADDGPHGVTNLVHLDGGPLATQLGELPITEAASVTVSFWFKVMAQPPGQPIMTFADFGNPAETIRLSHVEKELGWRSSTSNFFVPMTASGSILAIGAWNCVSILLKPTSMTLRYRGQNQSAIVTLVTDNVSTPNVDASWQTLPVANRSVRGSPAFGGVFNGVATEMFLDDVRIASDDSSVCDF